MDEAKVIIAKMTPLANTPIHQVFPCLGSCLITCCSCCNTDRRKQRKAELKVLMKEEKLESERKMNEVFRRQNINFTGTGESAAAHHTNEEEDDEAAEYNPFGSLGYGYEAYFASL